METLKLYSRSTLDQILRVVCERRQTKSGTLKEALPYFDLRDDGLWLAQHDPALHDSTERPFFEWHPRENTDLAALPVPFAAYELAAFLLDGGGYFVHAVFNNGASLDAEAIAALGNNSLKAREALNEAHRLCLEASLKFPSDNVDSRKKARWMLSYGDARRRLDRTLPIIDAAVQERSSSKGVPLSAGEEAESPQGEPTGIPTREMAELLDGIEGIDDTAWRKRLGDLNNAKWSLPALVVRGSGGKSYTWNPVTLAGLLLDRKIASYKDMNRIFLEKAVLRRWLAQWQNLRSERNWLCRG